jgi:hypothetical protein
MAKSITALKNQFPNSEISFVFETSAIRSDNTYRRKELIVEPVFFKIDKEIKAHKDMPVSVNLCKNIKPASILAKDGKKNFKNKYIFCKIDSEPSTLEKGFQSITYYGKKFLPVAPKLYDELDAYERPVKPAEEVEEFAENIF